MAVERFDAGYLHVNEVDAKVLSLASASSGYSILPDDDSTAWAEAASLSPIQFTTYRRCLQVLKEFLPQGVAMINAVPAYLKRDNAFVAAVTVRFLHWGYRTVEWMVVL